MSITEYETVRELFDPKSRWTFIAVFVFWLVPTVGSYMAFGREVWVSRVLTYISGFLALVVVGAFADRLYAQFKRSQLRKSGAVPVMFGDKNCLWTTDRDPEDPGVV